MAELVWRCILEKQLQKILAVILGCMSAAILLAEATLLTSGVDLSLFSILIKSVGNEEFLVQIFAFVPLMYMCVCTYYSLFKVGRLMFYSLTPRQTSAVSLLMICSMVARYAPPISYNFLNLISLDGNKKIIFERRMGNIDEVVPFFGHGFNRIYPLIMVIYTILVASNFFDRIISFFGNWKIFRLHTEADDMDGFDPSGLILIAPEKVLLINFLKQFFGKKFDDSVTNFEKSFRTAFIALASINDWTNRIEEHLAPYAPVIERYVMQKTRSNELRALENDLTTTNLDLQQSQLELKRRRMEASYKQWKLVGLLIAALIILVVV